MNPFTVPHATRADLDDALAAAEQGFKVWSRTSPAKRAETILEAESWFGATDVLVDAGGTGAGDWGGLCYDMTGNIMGHRF
jgi:hypothetical protein